MKNLLLFIAGILLTSAVGFAQYTGGSGDGYSSGTSAVGWASPSTSLITVSPLAIVADGSSTSTVTVQLKDASNNNLTSGGDVVTLSGSAGSLSSVTDQGNGSYTATLTSTTTVGNANISGTMNGVAISDTAIVPFIAGAATKYIVTSSSSSPAAGSNVTITAQLSDANNNPVRTASNIVTWSKSDVNGTFATATSTTNGSGIASVVFTTHTVAGTSTTVTGTDAGTLTGTSSAITTTASLPVELTSFTANSKGRNVELAWKTATEVNSSKFEVERNNGKEWTKVSSVDASGTSNAPKEYSYVDKLKSAAIGSISYRLKMIDNDGKFEYSKIADVKIVPRVYALEQNYPNPFNPETKIQYSLPVDAKVTLKVYDIVGREIATIVNEQQTAGYYEQKFGGYNMSSGVYFYRIVAESGGKVAFTGIKKMVMIK